MKKGSQESIKNQINHYTAKHRQADEELGFEQRRRTPDSLKVSRLKKLKLMCKDKLTELNQQLAAKQKPPKPSADVIQLPVPQPVASTAMSPRRVATG